MPQGDDELTQTRGSSEPPTEAASPARTWGDFRLISELGRGGFGRVYHAWDPTLTRDIALKIVRLPDATAAATALHEGRMLARVRHRNVVTVYGAQQIGEEVGVWMELIRGRHLSQLVREQGPMGAEEATVVGISVCQALAAVHAAGLLHRDIKANNVMRESGGRIVLMDFGAGRESGSALAGDLAGTPVYMAPEILRGGPASPNSDLYSVGVLLFYVTTGEYPVVGHSMLELSLAHQRGERRLLADRRPDLPDGFVRAVERALAPSHQNRPASAGAMLRDLSNALPGSQPWETTDHRVDLMPTPGGRGPIALLPATVSVPAERSRLLIWLGDGLATIVAIGLFGILTSMAFDQSLGRDSAYSTESFADWWLFGARSLLWPAILIMVVIISGRLLITVWRGLQQVIPGLKKLAEAASVGAVRVARQLGAVGPVAGSQWLLFVQVVALIAVWRRFVPIMEAIIDPATADGAKLGLLANSSQEPLYFQSAAALLVFGMAFGWYRLLSIPTARSAIHWSTLVAGAAVLVIALLMLVVPYRLLYHNEMPRVMVGAERCYRLGVHDGQVLLYCPDRPAPRVATADESLVVPTGISENIFSPAAVR